MSVKHIGAVSGVESDVSAAREDFVTDPQLGRSQITFWFDALAPTTSEVLQTFNLSTNFGAPASAASYTVPGGSRLFITSFSAFGRSSTTTMNIFRAALRAVPSGAVLITSPKVLGGRFGFSTPTAPVAEMSARLLVVQPVQPIIIPTGGQIGITLSAFAANGSIDVIGTGYLAP